MSGDCRHKSKLIVGCAPRTNQQAPIRHQSGAYDAPYDKAVPGLAAGCGRRVRNPGGPVLHPAGPFAMQFRSKTRQSADLRGKIAGMKLHGTEISPGSRKRRNHYTTTEAPRRREGGGILWGKRKNTSRRKTVTACYYWYARLGSNQRPTA